MQCAGTCEPSGNVVRANILHRNGNLYNCACKSKTKIISLNLMRILIINANTTAISK